MNRLFIDELTSIGAVEDGDNPLSTILFYKRAEHPSVVSLAAYLERLDRGIADSRDGNERIRATIQQINDERPPMPTETIDDVLARIDSIANAMMKADRSLTKAQAKAAAWKDNPELVAKSRNAPRSTKVEADDYRTRIKKVVNARAAALQERRDNWTLSVHELRNRVWHTPDGELLKALDRELQRNQGRIRRVTSEDIVKSMPAGYAVLKKWETDPTAGL